MNPAINRKFNQLRLEKDKKLFEMQAEEMLDVLLGLEAQEVKQERITEPTKIFHHLKSSPGEALCPCCHSKIISLAVFKSPGFSGETPLCPKGCNKIDYGTIRKMFESINGL